MKKKAQVVLVNVPQTVFNLSDDMRFIKLKVASLSRTAPVFSDIQIKDKAKEVKKFSESEIMGRVNAGGMITVEVRGGLNDPIDFQALLNSVPIQSLSFFLV